MSSALKPALPPAGGQSSPGNPASAAGKPLSGSQGMAQHAGTPGPYSSGPLGHVPQNLAGLPHPHSNMGMPATNMAANMSISSVANMAQCVGGHSGMNQTPAHNIQGSHTSPIKGSVLPTTVAASTSPSAVAHGRPYLPSASNAQPGSVHSTRDEEGTTLPPSQNSAQLMAVHRAQQQQHHPPLQHHHDQQQSIPDRYKQQQQQQPSNQQQQSNQQPSNQQQLAQQPATQSQSHQQSQQQQQQTQPQQQSQQQHQQSNGTADSACTKNTMPPVACAPAPVSTKSETQTPAAPSVQNHVSPSAGSVNNDINNVAVKQTTATDATSPPIVNASVPPPPSITTVPPTAEPKTTATTTPTKECVTEAPSQPATTPTKAAVVPKETPKPQSTLKLATTPRNTSRKREAKTVKSSDSSKSTASSPTKTPDGKSPGAQNNRPPDKGTKTPRTPSEERKSKRTRTRTQPYQSPLPELALITKLSSSSASPTKAQDEKLIVFYKNEFLAVRNAEGGFYVCQAVQNVYKSSMRIRIRWLSQDKQDKIYIPDFYDVTDFDCILTNLNMERVEKGKYNLPKDELERTENILKRALAVESGASAPSLTEEHPDGLDLSLFRDESQLKKKPKSLKRKSTESLSPDNGNTNNRKTKRTPDKSKVRKVSKSPAPRSALKRNNQQTSDKKMANDKKDSSSGDKSNRRSDGGRAERAKRRGGDTASPSSAKTSPVVDQKKARVLAKVALKNAIPASTSALNKKKAVGKATASGSGKVSSSATTASVKTGVKTSTRSQAVAPSVSAASTSSASARRKKTKK